LSQASTGRAKNDGRRAKSLERRAKNQTAANKQLNEKISSLAKGAFKDFHQYFPAI
jgi:hypothetical protein